MFTEIGALLHVSYVPRWIGKDTAKSIIGKRHLSPIGNHAWRFYRNVTVQADIAEIAIGAGADVEYWSFGDNFSHEDINVLVPSEGFDEMGCGLEIVLHAQANAG